MIHHSIIFIWLTVIDRKDTTEESILTLNAGTPYYYPLIINAPEDNLCGLGSHNRVKNSYKCTDECVWKIFKFLTECGKRRIGFRRHSTAALSQEWRVSIKL